MSARSAPNSTTRQQESAYSGQPRCRVGERTARCAARPSLAHPGRLHRRRLPRSAPHRGAIDHRDRTGVQSVDATQLPGRRGPARRRGKRLRRLASDGNAAAHPRFRRRPGRPAPRRLGARRRPGFERRLHPRPVPDEEVPAPEGVPAHGTERAADAVRPHARSRRALQQLVRRDRTRWPVLPRGRVGHNAAPARLRHACAQPASGPPGEPAIGDHRYAQPSSTERAGLRLHQRHRADLCHQRSWRRPVASPTPAAAGATGPSGRRAPAGHAGGARRRRAVRPALRPAGGGRALTYLPDGGPIPARHPSGSRRSP